MKKIILAAIIAVSASSVFAADTPWPGVHEWSSQAINTCGSTLAFFDAARVNLCWDQFQLAESEWSRYYSATQWLGATWSSTLPEMMDLFNNYWNDYHNGNWQWRMGN